MITELKCPKCGSKSEGKFCCNCGSPLSLSQKPLEQKSLEVPKESSWLDKCPVCKSGKLSIADKKKLFGLMNDGNIECNSCHARFDPTGNKYRLSYVEDAFNLTWQEHGNQLLEEREWQNIAYGGASDEKQKETRLTEQKSNDATELDPRYVKNQSDEGMNLRDILRKGNNDEAIRESDEGMNLLEEGRDFLKKGKYDEAIRACDEAIKIDPLLFANAAWVGEGLAFHMEGKYDEAIQAYDKAIEMDPKDAITWFNKGASLFAQDKYDEAIQAYDKAIEINPQYALAWNKKGSAFYMQSKYDEAIQAYDKAIEINPQYALAWNKKGLALKALGRMTEAEAAFDEASALGYKK